MKQFFILALRQMQRRKTNSYLTLLGIVIGITTIISLIALGQGLENAIAGQLESLGNDKLFIAPKGNPFTPGLSTDAVKLTEDDLEVIEQTDGVRRAAGYIITTAKIEHNDLVRYFFVFGMSDDPEDRALTGESKSLKIFKGRSIEKGDRNKVVLGYEYLEEGLFEEALDVGDKILIHDQEFTIVGFWEKIGSPPDDRSAMIPIDTYADLFGTADELGSIVVQTQVGESIDAVAENIEKELRNFRNVDEDQEDFTVQTPEQAAAAFTTIVSLVQVVLIGIAIISVLVGGVGIMNAMYTSVLERTKEIGVMKALGAKRRDLFLIFLIESGVYGLVGGIIGLALGAGIAKGVEALFVAFIGPALLVVEIGWGLLGFTLLFSFLLGALSGVFPAIKAAKVNPVDSLRYE